jgi:integrase
MHMAWVETKGRRFCVVFRLGDARCKKTLATSDCREADATAARVERRIELLRTGDCELPPDVPVADALISEGRVERPVNIPAGVTLQRAFAEYLDALPPGSIEATTRRTVELHLRQLTRVLGGSTRLETIGFPQLQRYVEQRSQAAGRRGQPLTGTTIKKELTTLNGVWSWAIQMGYAREPRPRRGLKFPKADEKPPFQTFTAIQQQVQRGKLTESESAAMWDCLYLTTEKLSPLLAHVDAHARCDWLSPMALMVAHTGARRSELLRCEVGDFDLEAGTVRIRECKRVHGTRTSRSVPLSPRLKARISQHLSQARGKLVFQQDDGPITVHEAHDHLRVALAGGPWQNLRGWHVFQHSFLSNCASRGVDQQMIDAWVGHQTEAMQRRYRHLLPSAQQSALERVFGGE